MTTRIFPLKLLGFICILGCNSSEDVVRVPSRPQEFPKDVDAALGNSAVFELYSLDPLDYDFDNRKRTDDAARLYGWKVLGHVQLNDAKQRRDIINAFRIATAEEDDMVVHCFDPRHAIRVEYEGHVMDLLICFKCGSVHVRLDREEHFYLDVTDESGSNAEPVFDRILKAQGIPLAKK